MSFTCITHGWRSDQTACPSCQQATATTFSAEASNGLTEKLHTESEVKATVAAKREPMPCGHLRANWIEQVHKCSGDYECRGSCDCPPAHCTACAREKAALALFAQKVANRHCDSCHAGLPRKKFIWRYVGKALTPFEDESGTYGHVTTDGFTVVQCRADEVLSLADPSALAAHDAALVADLLSGRCERCQEEKAHSVISVPTGFAGETGPLCTECISMMINDGDDRIAKLEADNAKLRESVLHLAQSNHGYSPDACSACGTARKPADALAAHDAALRDKALEDAALIADKHWPESGHVHQEGATSCQMSISVEIRRLKSTYGEHS